MSHDPSPILSPRYRVVQAYDDSGLRVEQWLLVHDLHSVRQGRYQNSNNFFVDYDIMLTCNAAVAIFWDESEAIAAAEKLNRAWAEIFK